MNRKSDVRPIAVVLAGGSGSRFGGSVPKQLALLGRESVLYYSIRAMDDVEAVEEIVVAVNPEWSAELTEVARNATRRTKLHIVSGGSERNDSVRNALSLIGDLAGHQDRKILVHDGVRPLASTSLICRVIDALDTADAVIPVIPSADPIVEVVEGRVVGFANRARYERGQSPQGFWYEQLAGAVERLGGEVNHFSTVFEALLAVDPGANVQVTPGESDNIKVTVPIDRAIAGQLMFGVS